MTGFTGVQAKRCREFVLIATVTCILAKIVWFVIGQVDRFYPVLAYNNRGLYPFLLPLFVARNVGEDPLYLDTICCSSVRAWAKSACARSFSKVSMACLR